MTKSELVSIIYSYIGHLALGGDPKAMRFLYGNIWSEEPAVIRTISEIQDRLSPVELINGSYCDEFLYYYGMTCLGEQSPLIIKDLPTAEACFTAVQPRLPLVDARLAYIGLLTSKEMYQS